jgi:GTP-binding protein HflX
VVISQGHPPKRLPKIYEVRSITERKERAVLVGLASSNHAETLDELESLTLTAGAEVVERILQRRDSIDPGTFLSRGKIDFLRAMVDEKTMDLVVFDEDLSPAQMRNLEKRLETKILDRNELILAIFADRARTREARLQVELAQLEYLLPRLTKMWGHLSRQQGGIGTRGPGETQLEVDRRRVREKIAFLKRKLEGVEKERRVQRSRRTRVHRTALVGYTNAGKSTLLNSLTGAGVLAENKLFATLDATTRRYRFPSGGITLFTDTVGFIRKLPHHLVASFRSTLEEVVEADLLLHVVDASSPHAEEQIEAVLTVLVDLKAAAVPTVMVLNKIDAAPEDRVTGLIARHTGAIPVSAEQRTGLDVLRREVEERVTTPPTSAPAGTR